MIHILKGFYAKNLTGSSLSILGDETLAELLHQDLLGGIGVARRYFESSHKLFKCWHLVVLDLILDVLCCVGIFKHLLKGMTFLYCN